jgi:hypothetical protein
VQHKALMTVRSEDGPPTLEDAARQIGVNVGAVDAEFGVIPIDPSQGLYSVQVDAAQLPSGVDGQEPYRGPFSNPRIEHFGPPQTDASGDGKKRSG